MSTRKNYQTPHQQIQLETWIEENHRIFQGQKLGARMIADRASKALKRPISIGHINSAYIRLHMKLPRCIGANRGPSTSAVPAQSQPRPVAAPTPIQKALELPKEAPRTEVPTPKGNSRIAMLEKQVSGLIDVVHTLHQELYANSAEKRFTA